MIEIDQPLADPIGFELCPYSSVPKCYALLDMEAMNQAGITQVQNYPTLELMGENVMIGFVDTGIDYTHPVFRALDGGTRIAAICEQTIHDGMTTEGCLYGTEYTE